MDNNTKLLRTYYITRCYQPLILYLTIIVIISPQLIACTTHQKETRAYIDENIDWSITEKCGYQNCNPMVDYLSSKYTTLRIEFDRNNKNEFFVIRVWFISPSDNLEFEPSHVKTIFNNGDRVTPKTFTCSNTIWDLNYLRNHPSLQGNLPVKDRSCYLLFFDHPAPSITEEVNMDISSALLSYGKPILVPKIYFRKNNELAE